MCDLNFDCLACSKSENLKEIRGCTEKALNPVCTVECVRCGSTNKDCDVCGGTGQENIYRCPVKLVSEVSEYITVYNFYKKGILPETGGVLDQSNIVIQVCLFLEGKIAEYEREKVENGK